MCAIAITVAGSVKRENHKKRGAIEKATSRKPTRELVGTEMKWPQPSKTREILSLSDVKFMV